MSHACLSFVKNAIDHHHTLPKKHLSQNFLIDANIAKKILLHLEIQAEDHILEIGPGLGALTKEIYNQPCSFLAIEKDASFAPVLSFLSPNQLLLEDALQVDWLKQNKKIKILSNVPYNISQPLVKKMLHYYPFVSKAVLMVQKEFADKLFHQDCSLGVILQLYGTITRLFTVSRNCFFPKPQIESCVIKIDFHDHPIDQELINLIERGWSFRRKQLINNLHAYYSRAKLEKALQLVDLPHSIRAEELSLQDWELLFHALHPSK